MTTDGGQTTGLKDEDKWVQEDNRALEIIQQSLSDSILEAYIHCETAKKLWESLEAVYGNISNFGRVFEFKKAISDLKQEEEEFNKHLGKFRCLWSELKVLRPSTVDPEILQERLEQDAVFSLLFSLNSSYNQLIKHILREDKLPDLDTVCALVQREQSAHQMFKEKKEDM